MQHFKYYTPGYPEHSVLPVYGLHQHKLDCFLIIAETLSLAIKLRQILSSRYPLTMVCLNTAQNFSPNLVDNEVCENWSYTGTPPYAEELVEARPEFEWDLAKEKQWCLMCRFYLEFLKRVRTPNINTETLNITVGLSEPSEFYNQYKVLESQVWSAMYFGKEFEQTDQEIRQIISGTDLQKVDVQKILQDLENTCS
jgi:hypothetical protein